MTNIMDNGFQVTQLAKVAEMVADAVIPGGLLKAFMWI